MVGSVPGNLFVSRREVLVDPKFFTLDGCKLKLTGGGISTIV